MPSRRIVLLIVVLFAATLLVRLPARWAAELLPTGIECHGPAGTVWNGRCRQLQVAAVALSGAGWQLQPAQLLRGALVLNLHSADPRASGRLQLWLRSGGRLELRNFNAQVQLAGDLIPPLRNQWRGQIQLVLSSVVLQSLQPRALVGSARVTDLQQVSPALEFGSYELLFPPRVGDQTDIVGTLRDLQGPMAVQGQLRLQPSGEYAVEGTVAARPTAAAELQRLIEFLGPADAQGTRAFSLAGTL